MRRTLSPLLAAIAALAFTLTSPTPAHAQPDHPNDCAAAAPLTVGAPPVAGVIDPVEDEDWFAFEATPGGLYRITCLPTSAGVWPTISIFRDDCAQPLFLEWPQSIIDLPTPSGGPHRIRITAAWAGRYELTVTDLGPNPDEAGDAPESAAPLPTDGTPVIGRTDYSGDMDWYRLPLQELVNYRIQVTNISCNATQWTLRDRDGATPLQGGSSYSSPGFSGCSEWSDPPPTFLVPEGEGGDYFLVVHGWPDTGMHRITVTPLATYPPGDDHADDCASATPLTPGAPPVTAILSPATDVDAFAFHANAGRLYRFTERRPFAILMPDCQTPVPQPRSPYSAGLFVAPTSGVYTALYRPTPLRSVVAAVAVTDEGPANDDHANAGPDVTPLPVGGPAVSGRIDYANDVDAFSFPVQRGGIYRVELVQTACRSVAADVFPPDPLDAQSLRTLGGGPCGAGASAHLLVYHAGDAGFGHIEVHGWTIATYTIRVELITVAGPGDDHADLCELATSIPVGAEPLLAIFDPPGDVDWFRFDAQAGRAYAVRVEPSVYYDRIVADIRGPGCDGAHISALGDYLRHFRADADGPYFVGVRSVDLSYRPPVGSYTVRLEDLGPADDDHPNTPPSATRARTDGTPAEGRIDYQGDNDLFQVWLRPRTFYRMELRIDNCTHASAALHSPGTWIHRTSLIRTHPPECNDAPRYPFIYYTPSFEPGDHLISVEGQPGTRYTLTIHPIGCTADIDHSGTVDSADLSAFITRWLAALALPYPDALDADFNGDATVNSTDISAFITAWLSAAQNGC